jgi:hypothetical protein
MPESPEQDTDLKGPCCNKVIETNRSPRMILQEHHQEAKSNENHDMNILPHSILIMHEIDNEKLLLLYS